MRSPGPGFHLHWRTEIQIKMTRGRLHSCFLWRVTSYLLWRGGPSFARPCQRCFRRSGYTAPRVDRRPQSTHRQTAFRCHPTLYGTLSFHNRGSEARTCTLYSDFFSPTRATFRACACRMSHARSPPFSLPSTPQFAEIGLGGGDAAAGPLWRRTALGHAVVSRGHTRAEPSCANHEYLIGDLHK